MDRHWEAYYARTGGNFTIAVEMTREEADAVMRMPYTEKEEDFRLQREVRRRITRLKEEKVVCQ